MSMSGAGKRCGSAAIAEIDAQFTREGFKALPPYVRDMIRRGKVFEAVNDMLAKEIVISRGEFARFSQAMLSCLEIAHGDNLRAPSVRDDDQEGT